MSFVSLRFVGFDAGRARGGCVRDETTLQDSAIVAASAADLRSSWGSSVAEHLQSVYSVTVVVGGRVFSGLFTFYFNIFIFISQLGGSPQLTARPHI